MRTSLEKVFAVLEVIAAADKPVSLKVIAEETGHNPSTLSRVLSDLVQIGYVRKHGYREFALDLGLIPLGQKALSHFPLPRIANPLIHEVATRLGVEGALAGLHRGKMVYLYRTGAGLESGTMSRAFDFPLYKSVAGLVILAFSPEADVRGLLECSMREDGVKPREAARLLAGLLKKIGDVSGAGYICQEDDGGWNVSFPLRKGGGLFAVSLHGGTRPASKMEAVVLECSLLVRRIEQAGDIPGQ